MPSGHTRPITLDDAIALAGAVADQAELVCNVIALEVNEAYRAVAASTPVVPRVVGSRLAGEK